MVTTANLTKILPKSQNGYWDTLHRDHKLDPHVTNATDFARSVGWAEDSPGKILELGCGLGDDARYLASLGHSVTALDVSSHAVRASRRRHSVAGLKFVRHDMRRQFRFLSESFDVVYARFSFHYFTDMETRKIADEIHRMLRPSGRLYLMCKSTSDPLHGQGNEIEPNMYDLEGHIRHFFSVDYLRSVLAEGRLFDVRSVAEGNGTFYGYHSAFIEASAEKRPI